MFQYCRVKPFCSTIFFLVLKHVKPSQIPFERASIVLLKHPRNQELTNYPDTSENSSKNTIKVAQSTRAIKISLG